MKKYLLYTLIAVIGLIFLANLYHELYIKPAIQKETLMKEPHYELTYDVACEAKINDKKIQLTDTCYAEHGVIYLYHYRVVVNNDKIYLIKKSEDNGNVVVLLCEDNEGNRFVLTVKFMIGGSVSIAESSKFNPSVINIKAYSIREIN